MYILNLCTYSLHVLYDIEPYMDIYIYLFRDVCVYTYRLCI